MKSFPSFRWYLLFWGPFAVWLVFLFLLVEASSLRGAGPVGAGVGVAVYIFIAVIGTVAVLAGPLFSLLIQKYFAHLNSWSLPGSVMIPAVMAMAVIASGHDVSRLPASFESFWTYLAFVLLPLGLVFLFVLVSKKAKRCSTGLIPALGLVGVLGVACVGFSVVSFERGALGYFQGSPRVDILVKPTLLQRLAISNLTSGERQAFVTNHSDSLLSAFFRVARTSSGILQTTERLKEISENWDLDFRPVCNGFFGVIDGTFRLEGVGVDCRRQLLVEMLDPALCSGLELSFFRDFEPILRAVERESPAAAALVARFLAARRPYEPAPDWSQANPALIEYLSRLHVGER